jgi:polyisoprenoid-binding protein YceI
MLLRLIAALMIVLPAAASGASWRLDPSTSVAVDILWHGATVVVRFPRLSGTVEFDLDNPQDARAEISVSARAATTGIAVVDVLVRSADYLGAEKFPVITFQLDRLRQTSRSTADITGRITLRGVTRPMIFKAEVFRYGPSEGDPDVFEAGFNLTGSIDRRKFGSTGGLPDVPAVLPVRIHLLMVES